MELYKYLDVKLSLTRLFIAFENHQ